MTDIKEIENKGLPYGCDYAKTNRSTCKDDGCKSSIEQNDIRMSARTRSNFHEGLQDNWFHFDCFWKHARRGINEASIRHFEHLKWDDQERIRVRIQRKDDMADDSKSSHPKAGYAKSGRGTCIECKGKVANEEIRIEFRSGFWHPKCLSEKHLYTKLAEDITDFDTLKEKDQQVLRQLFTGPNENDIKKVDAGHDDEMTLSELKQAKEKETDQEKKKKLQDLEDRKEALKKQTDLIWKAKDAIEKAVKVNGSLKTQKAKKEFVENLIKKNGGNPFKKGTMDDHVQFLADILVFGGFSPCPDCSSTNFYYSPDRRVYQCSSGCSYFSRNIGRKPFKASSGAKGLSEYDGKIVLPAGRIFSKSVEEHAEEEKLISIVPKSAKKVEPSRKRKKEPEGTMKENGYSVDAYFPLADDFHVFVENGDPHQFLLHKIDEKTGDKKFYKMQLLESDDNGEYRIFRRYGVVLTDTMKDMVKECKSFEEALHEFEKVFREKAGFAWSERDKKKSAAKGYSLIEWNVNLSGTYGRASYETNDDAVIPVKKEKIKEEDD